MFNHSKGNVEGVLSHIEERHRARRGGWLDEKRIARSSAVKASMKDPVKKELQAPHVKELTARAEALYEDLVVASNG